MNDPRQNVVRRSAVRTLARIAAGEHRRSIGQERSPTSSVAEDFVTEEKWGPHWASYVCSIFTAGLHLPIQFPILQKRHRNKLINVMRSLSFKVMDAYIANISQEEGMIPTVANLIQDKLRSHDASFVANELDKVPLLDDRLDMDELEYITAMTSILKSLSRDGKRITVETVATEAKKELRRMAGENYTMEFANGGGLRQIEYREELSALCIRNVESDEIKEITRQDLERDSRKYTLRVAGRPEGTAIFGAEISGLKEVFKLQEKQITTMSSSRDIRGKWKPVKYLSDLDGSGDEVTARVWYLILNHLNPERYSFKESSLAQHFKPRSTSGTNPQELTIDIQISNKERQVLLLS